MISYSETLYKQKQTEKDSYESGQAQEGGWNSVEKSSQCPEKTLRLPLNDEVRVSTITIRKVKMVKFKQILFDVLKWNFVTIERRKLKEQHYQNWHWCF